MKRVAILQSNYIPWKGYFDIIRSVDEFVFLDDVQYTRRDWRNRNYIKSSSGLQWVTIPVNVKGNYFTKIQDVKISDPDWGKDHWNKISAAYNKAPFFQSLSSQFAEFYQTSDELYLSMINRKLIAIVNSILGIETPLRWSSEFESSSDKTERLVDICVALGATCYLSGPAAKAYLNETSFNNQNISVEWMDYTGYPTYHQLHPPFEHGVSVLDLIFNEGPDSTRFMKNLSR